MRNAARSRGYTNTLYRRMTFLYALILLLMASFLCYMAYSKEHNTIVNQMDQHMIDLNHEYESVTEDIWRRYMPLWTNKDRVYSALESYFNDEDNGVLSPIEHKNIMDALQIIMSGDDCMKWIGIFRGPDEANYWMLQGGYSLIEMTEEFPFYTHLVNKKPGLEIYEGRVVDLNGKLIRCFAMCGGTAMGMRNGRIIMGFESDALAADYGSLKETVPADYYITNEFGVIYSSKDDYDISWLSGSLPHHDVVRNADGEWMYIRQLEIDTTSYKVFCVVLLRDLFRESNVITPYILCILALFWGFSLILYRYAGSIILRRTRAIQVGLEKIAENNLDYRIPVPEKPNDEFEIISHSINEVTTRLQENINKVYLFKMRQKEAELSELQAKFDPHFLYNTLEVIRGKVYENGDEETADIIVKLAAIFRNFITADNFISIQEEMEFCSLYLSLLKYRYDDQVTIVYDIDSQILGYGIIRNLLQPLLENYFIHGFCSDKIDNRLSIRGKLWDDDYICFIIKDNGIGISDETLDKLKHNLNEVETSTRRGYGLKSVNRRAKLFYGQECGITIDRNKDGGATIRVLIRRMTCQEHKSRLSMEQE